MEIPSKRYHNSTNQSQAPTEDNRRRKAAISRLDGSHHRRPRQNKQAQRAIRHSDVRSDLIGLRRGRGDGDWEQADDGSRGEPEQHGKRDKGTQLRCFDPAEKENGGDEARADERVEAPDVGGQSGADDSPENRAGVVHGHDVEGPVGAGAVVDRECRQEKERRVDAPEYEAVAQRLQRIGGILEGSREEMRAVAWCDTRYDGVARNAEEAQD